MDKSRADELFCHQEIHNLVTRAFLKPFCMFFLLLFLFYFLVFNIYLLRGSAPFAGYSLGEFRVRWSRFDAVTDTGVELLKL